MGVERDPVIKDLEEFAETLPEGQRGDLFRLVSDLYGLGVVNGTVMGLIDPAGMREGGPKRIHLAYSQYFNKKFEEFFG